MGLTPHKRGITIGFDCQFEVQLKNCTLSSILTAFGELLSHLQADFARGLLLAMANM